MNSHKQTFALAAMSRQRFLQLSTLIGTGATTGLLYGCTALIASSGDQAAIDVTEMAAPDGPAGELTLVQGVEAGYADGFEMALISPNGRYLNDTLASEAIAGMWSEVGVQTTVQVMDWSPFVEGVLGKTHDAFFFQQVGVLLDATVSINFQAGKEGVAWKLMPTKRRINSSTMRPKRSMLMSATRCTERWASSSMTNVSGSSSGINKGCTVYETKSKAGIHTRMASFAWVGCISKASAMSGTADLLPVRGNIRVT